jgi:hypothetical protein
MDRQGMDRHTDKKTGRQIDTCTEEQIEKRTKKQNKKQMLKFTPAQLGACIIKLITAVIYSFRNKLECLSLASLSSLV